MQKICQTFQLKKKEPTAMNVMKIFVISMYYYTAKVIVFRIIIESNSTHCLNAIYHVSFVIPCY